MVIKVDEFSLTCIVLVFSYSLWILTKVDGIGHLSVCTPDNMHSILNDLSNMGWSALLVAILNHQSFDQREETRGILSFERYCHCPYLSGVRDCRTTSYNN